MTEYENLIYDSRAPESRQTQNNQVLKHDLPLFWVNDLGPLHSHYDNPSGFIKYKKKMFLDHISETLLGHLATLLQSSCSDQESDVISVSHLLDEFSLE